MAPGKEEIQVPHFFVKKDPPLSSIHLLRPADYAWSQSKGKRQEEPPHIG